MIIFCFLIAAQISRLFYYHDPKSRVGLTPFKTVNTWFYRISDVFSNSLDFKKPLHQGRKYGRKYLINKQPIEIQREYEAADLMFSKSSRYLLKPSSYLLNKQAVEEKASFFTLMELLGIDRTVNERYGEHRELIDYTTLLEQAKEMLKSKDVKYSFIGERRSAADFPNIGPRQKLTELLTGIESRKLYPIATSAEISELFNIPYKLYSVKDIVQLARKYLKDDFAKGCVKDLQNIYSHYAIKQHEYYLNVFFNRGIFTSDFAKIQSSSQIWNKHFLINDNFVSGPTALDNYFRIHKESDPKLSKVIRYNIRKYVDIFKAEFERHYRETGKDLYQYFAQKTEDFANKYHAPLVLPKNNYLQKLGFVGIGLAAAYTGLHYLFMKKKEHHLPNGEVLKVQTL